MTRSSQHMNGRFVASQLVLSEHVPHGSEAQAGELVEIVGNVGSNGPGLLLVSRRRSSVDDDLARASEPLVEINNGPSLLLAVSGDRAFSQNGAVMYVSARTWATVAHQVPVFP
jgi:hypothetical protein